jgi:hypothetical protein
VVKCGPAYAGAAEAAEPVEPAEPTEPVVGDMGGAGRLIDGVGAGVLGATAALAWGRAPVPLAWCDPPEAHAEARIIKPAVPTAAAISRQEGRM